MSPRVARSLLVAVFVAVFVAGFVGTPLAHAEAPVPVRPVTKPVAAPVAKAAPTRAVEAIIADTLKAMGGAEALGKHRSLRTKMTITFQGLGISGTAEHLGAAGDRALTITNIPGVASTREGTDGSRSWSQDPINGLRILSGVEAEQSRIEAAWNGELRMKELFPKIEAANEVGSDGASLECLILTPKIGPPLTRCFDAKTHLMVSERGVRAGPQGDTPFVARAKDWRPVGDLKMPFQTEMQVGPLSFVGTVTSTELDGVLDAAVFAVPEPSTPGGAGGSGGRADSKAKAIKKARPAMPKADPPAKAGAAPSDK